jgi:autotransporter-associated beta strand protein
MTWNWKYGPHGGGPLRLSSLLTLLLLAVGAPLANAQTSFTDVTATGAWNASRWNNSTDGPTYSATYTQNNNVNFTSGNYSFAGMGTTINVGNINVASGANVNFTSAANTFATNGAVRTITVGAGSTLDFQGQSFSTASGTGFIKAGDGVLALAGNTYNGGFTLNAGTVIARGVNAFGGATTNVLTLNGGTVASNATRSFDNTKYGGGIVIGGNVQFGELATNVVLANSTANLSFANNVSLGNANRTLTLGNNGTQTFSGVISNTGSGGVTFAANSGAGGRFDITNAANTFTGDITITGGEVRFTSDGSMGNSGNDIIIDGGRFATASDATFTLGAGRDVFIGDGVGTSISTPGAGVFTINSGIADKTGEIGSWAKQGGGTLELGGASTYTGSTAINNGTVRLTTDDNRLPTGTVVSMGQAASANLGTLDLNGRNQEIAGLQSTTGTNSGVNTNVVTSAASSTLTINNSGNFVYSDGTTANSGVITGAISLVKNGTGMQTLGGANTYSGTTTVNGGTLIIAASGTHTGGGAYTVNNVGTLTVNGTINSAVTVNNGGTLTGAGTLGALTIDGILAPGNSIGTINTGTVVWNGAPDDSQAWQFELGPGNTSDLLNIAGDFTKGSSGKFAFDFLNSTELGTFTLASWSGTTNFSLSDFSYVNLGGGNQGTFAFSGSGKSLQFNVSAVPEPSSLVLFGLIGGVAAYRMRRRRAKVANEAALGA